VRIKALFFDVDGVLTDGRIYLAGDGREFKVFNTKDGHGMRKAMATGLRVAWISGRTSPATAARAKDLGVRACFQGVRDKLAEYEMLCRRWKVEPRETASIGDDEPDVPMMEAAGFSACPADAAPQARRAATVVLKSPGGYGAAREFIELVLKRNGLPEARRRSRPAGSRSRREELSREAGDEPPVAGPQRSESGKAGGRDRIRPGRRPATRPRRARGREGR
jgi:3-deoxy-D-manno-octulosonate 8-phosphate phosphatase (KDO 8-P phosphatase)